jgi:hypothetical protein
VLGILVRVFKTRWFARFARSEGIADRSLREAIERAERGLIDADLGGGLIKQRVARRGQGRSGGYRIVIAYRIRNRAVFLYGFAKNERENIDSDELISWRRVADYWNSANAEMISEGLGDGAILEVENDEEKQSDGRGNS